MSISIVETTVKLLNSTSIFMGFFHRLSSNDLLRQELERLYNRLFYFPSRSLDSEIVKAQERDYWGEHITIIEVY